MNLENLVINKDKRMSLRYIFVLLIASVSVKSIAQSSNDQCSGAVTLTIGAACTSGSIIAANTTTGDPTTAPACWSFSNDDGVWYKFQATATSLTIKVTDGGVTYTPQVAVYNGGGGAGTCPSVAATPIAGGCLNYTSTSSATLALTGLTINNWYYVLVDMPSTVAQAFCIDVYTQPPSSTSTSPGCPGTINTTVNAVSCSDIGTGAFNSTTGVVLYTDGAAPAPTPAPGCGAGSGGTWVRYDLAAGVTNVSMQFEGGTVGAGFSDMYVALYQGTCASLTLVSCNLIVDKVAGVLGVYNVSASGLDPSQDLWVYAFSGGGKAYDLNFAMIGSTGAPGNSSCATSIAAAGTACNVGASGAAFTTPYYGGVACTGGNWISNENTVFYSFTALSSTATLLIQNIICNDGTNGSAQFGVWTSCSSIGTYGAGFLGCAVGTNTLSLSGLTAGQTYYIVADGNGGNICTWNFAGTNITLPIELTEFKASLVENKVKLSWATASEVNNDYFTVERSKDAVNFETVSVEDGAGNSSHILEYTSFDDNPYKGVSYYRLKQTDFDGKNEYSAIQTIENNSSVNLNFEIIPNPSNAGDNYLNFNQISNSPLTITIIDMIGRKVFSEQIRLEQNKFALNERLASGVYTISVKGEQSILNKQMIIK